jgi:NAD(P)-dependent dehydrogenase (short-subunit alcohol dehydrogenase family)
MGASPPDAGGYLRRRHHRHRMRGRQLPDPGKRTADHDPRIDAADRPEVLLVDADATGVAVTDESGAPAELLPAQTPLAAAENGANRRRAAGTDRPRGRPACHPQPRRAPRRRDPSTGAGMPRLTGRVAIVTGAGRGLGRAHALTLAAHGAAVIVNDLGGDVTGHGSDLTPAQAVSDEITAAGGAAVVSGHDVSDWGAAAELVTLAVETFGRLDVLVNNAGILRDRTLANMTEAEWDAVIAVHLKGHAAPTRHALAYWREQARAGHPCRASVIHTSSASGLAGNIGQANYAAAKLAVVALSSVVRLEASDYGVRSNVIAPAAATRMGGEPPDTAGLEPERVSPLVAWLASADCPANGQIFQVHGRRISILALATVAATFTTDQSWRLDQLDSQLPPHLVSPTTVEDLIPATDLQAGAPSSVGKAGE